MSDRVLFGCRDGEAWANTGLDGHGVEDRVEVRVKADPTVWVHAVRIRAPAEPASMVVSLEGMPPQPPPSSTTGATRLSSAASGQASPPTMPAAVPVPTPRYRSTPSLGHTLAGSPTGNLPALHVAGRTLAWYLCRPVGLGESGHRDTTRCSTGQARRRQDRPGSIGVIGPAHSAPARVPRPGHKAGRGLATDRYGHSRPVADPVHLHESGKVGRRPVCVPVFVPFRSRRYLSWYAAHVGLTPRHLATVAGASFRPNAIDGGGRSHDQGAVVDGRTTSSPGRAASVGPSPTSSWSMGMALPGREGNPAAAGRSPA
jgi:hypothetical protein